MANANPPKKNQAFTFDIALQDLANSGSFKVTPTLASGDFKTAGDGGTPANLGTLPAVDPTATIWVKVTLSAAEMNFDRVVFQAIDQTSPKEWADYACTILTTA